MTLALLLPGCTLPEDLEAASVDVGGQAILGEELVLVWARVTAAPRALPPAGTEAAPVELAPGAEGRTAIARDHWVLIVELQEAAPGSAVGRRVASLEWNGAPHGPIHLQQRAGAASLDGARLIFDVGATLERSSLYILRVAPASSPDPEPRNR